MAITPKTNVSVRDGRGKTQRRRCEEIRVEPETGAGQVQATEPKEGRPFPRLRKEKRKDPKAPRERGSVNTV